MNDEAGIALTDDPLWYKDAIIYQLHVKAFYDSNNDGIGDLSGLTQKLDYIQDLGVNTLWLLPFYPSPMRDDGYDIADYRNINPDYGTRRDFRVFIREAHRRSIRVITELVINHTSDQHPWFQAARRAPPGSAKRDFYVWSDSVEKFQETRIIFTDTEASNWTWDPVAQAYYWHRFFSHQPDLNHNNPQVVRAVTRLMRFWLDLGVDGLRLDAIPYLCVREGTNNENLPETHMVLKEMRAVVDRHYKNRMFLAEANQWPEDVRDYFGDGDECHVAYHFPLMPRMYMAIGQEDRHPITEIMHQTPDIPDTCQWAIFLRNHDELTLEMVTDEERDYMYQMYATDPRMRLNVGIRRRLAPLLDNNRDKMELINSLLLSMPGSPIIYYGDEIGMGDNIFLGDRNGVRTPMQWSPDRNAGFSRADPARLYLPPVMDAVYGYEAVNVEAQGRSTSSLLNWMKRLIAVRQAHRAFGRGRLQFLHPGNRKILSYLREHQDESILCVANLSRSAQPVELNLSAFKGRVPIEMMGRTAFPPIGELPYLLTLPGHAFYWFLLTADAEVPSWHEQRLPAAAPPILVLSDGWKSFFPEQVEARRKSLAAQVRRQLQEEALPAFISSQRWFGAKGDSIQRVEMTEHAQWSGHDASWLMALFQVEGAISGAQTYFLPLSLVWEHNEPRVHAALASTVAKVRQHSRIGILADAFADESFCRAVIAAMGEAREISCAQGRLRFSATAAFTGLHGEQASEAVPMHQPRAQGSNTTVIVGERLFLKGYRHLSEGISPELEVGRFLTEVAHFPNSVPVLGALEYLGDDGTCMTLVLLQGYVQNQGDGWSYTLDYLERYLEQCLVGALEPLMAAADVHASYLAMVQKLGVRTGELHGALAVNSGDPAFDPEPIQSTDRVEWTKRIRAEAVATLDKLAQCRNNLPAAVLDDAQTLLDTRETLLCRIDALLPEQLQAAKARYHGDYHLGQVLLAQNDFLIIDFEGEPIRTLVERRMKHSPLKDVAGMLRSFNYAAYAMLYRLSAERPNDFAALEPYAQEWERQAAAAFLGGYAETAQACPCYPAEADHARRLIDLFTLEKALYEIRYELDNRPDWVSIPIKGLLALVSRD